jgi:5'(3')-deoxyribonucleotidase
MKRIGIDLDEVVLEFVKSFIKFYNKQNNTKIKYEDIKTYHFWEHGIGKNREDSIRWVDNFYNTNLYDRLLFVEGAKESINILNQDKILYIVTSKPIRHVPKTEKIIRKNLPQMDIYYSSDFHGGQSLTKAQIATYLCLDAIIEDNQNYASQCLEAGIRPLLLDKPWNQDTDPRIERVYNWKDILQKLK